MTNQFVNLPAPTGDGVGAAVDVSTLGALKSIVCGGDADATVNIEFNNDIGQAGGWHTAITFQPRGEGNINIAAKWMRVRVSGYNEHAGGTPTINIGAAVDEILFATLVAPANNGVGVAVDTSALGGFKTVQVGSDFKGTTIVEVSEDGTDWGQPLSFGSAGAQSLTIYAQWMRVRRSGVIGTNVGLPIVNVAAAPDPASTGPTPPFSSTVETIYVRTAGSDFNGDGKTVATAYETVQRAARDVPVDGVPGTIFVIDMTGVTEVLPDDYTFPAWKCGKIYETLFGHPLWVAYAGVNIVATPKALASIPLADTVVAGSDIASSAQEGNTQFRKITLNVARPSWGANALKGAYVLTAVGSQQNCEIYASDTTYIIVAGLLPCVPPLSIVENSAELSGLATNLFLGSVNFLNCDSIGVAGIKITSADGGVGLNTAGPGETVMQLCSLASPNVLTAGPLANRWLRCHVTGAPLASGAVIANQTHWDECTNPLASAGVTSISSLMFRQCVIQGGETFEATDTFQLTAPQPVSVPYLRMSNVLIIDVLGAEADGFRARADSALIERVNVSGCGRDGLQLLGTGHYDLKNCRSNGANGIDEPAGLGLRADSRADVVVDAATSAAPGTDSPLSGAVIGVGDMKVGDLAVRTWADFLSGASTLPVKEELDLTVAAAPGRATGTGSRVSQP